MIRADFDAFGPLFDRLAKFFRREVTADDTLIYFGSLSEHPFPAVEGAMRRAFQRCTRMPLPAELLTMIEGDRDARSYLAWERLWQAIRHVGPDSPVTFNDPVLHAVVERLGGWREVTLWDQLPVEERGYRGLEVRRLYQHLLEHPELTARAPDVLNPEGLEIGNALRVLDVRGLPEPVRPSRALPPASEAVALTGAEFHVRWEALVADVVTNHRPPAAAPRRLLPVAIERSLTEPPNAEEAAGLERRKRELLERYGHRPGETA